MNLNLILTTIVDYLELGFVVLMVVLVGTGIFSLTKNLIFAIQLRRLDSKIQRSLKERTFDHQDQ